MDVMTAPQKWSQNVFSFLVAGRKLDVMFEFIYLFYTRKMKGQLWFFPHAWCNANATTAQTGSKWCESLYQGHLGFTSVKCGGIEAGHAPVYTVFLDLTLAFCCSIFFRRNMWLCDLKEERDCLLSPCLRHKLQTSTMEIFSAGMLPSYILKNMHF